MIFTQLFQFYHPTRNLIKSNSHGQKWIHGTYKYKICLDISKKSAENILTLNWSLRYLLALCPKRCIKVYSLFSPTFLVRVFRQCTFARYVLNGHNYFCLQDNEIRCCEVKPREKIMETNTFWSCKHKIHFTPIWNILIFNKAGGTRG